MESRAHDTGAKSGLEPVVICIASIFLYIIPCGGVHRERREIESSLSCLSSERSSLHELVQFFEAFPSVIDLDRVDRSSQFHGLGFIRPQFRMQSYH
jgi:hypothetical protein